jgi:hypothetical protein
MHSDVLVDGAGQFWNAAKGAALQSVEMLRQKRSTILSQEGEVGVVTRTISAASIVGLRPLRGKSANGFPYRFRTGVLRFS